MIIQELHSATLTVPPEVLKLTENSPHIAKPTKPTKRSTSLSSKPSSSSVAPDPPLATLCPPGPHPNLSVCYMSVDTFLEILDEEELPPKSNLATHYSGQFTAHGFRTVNDLVDSDFLNPKVLSELFEPVLPFATCLRILKRAKEEALRAQGADYSNPM